MQLIIIYIYCKKKRSEWYLENELFDNTEWINDNVPLRFISINRFFSDFFEIRIELVKFVIQSNFYSRVSRQKMWQVYL